MVLDTLHWPQRADEEGWRYLVCLKYWPVMVYPEVLFSPNFITKGLRGADPPGHRLTATRSSLHLGESEPLPSHGGLNAVCYQVSRQEAVAHSLSAHGNRIAYTHRIEPAPALPQFVI